MKYVIYGGIILKISSTKFCRRGDRKYANGKMVCFDVMVSGLRRVVVVTPTYYIQSKRNVHMRSCVYRVLGSL